MEESKRLIGGIGHLKKPNEELAEATSFLTQQHECQGAGTAGTWGNCSTQGPSGCMGAGWDPTAPSWGQGHPTALPWGQGHPTAPCTVKVQLQQLAMATVSGSHQKWGISPSHQKAGSAELLLPSHGLLSISQFAGMRRNYWPDNWQACPSSGPSPSSFSRRSKRHIQLPALARHLCAAWSCSWLTSACMQAQT